MTICAYIAGASSERAEVSAYMQRLRDAGIEVTLDWPAEIDANGGLANEGLTEKQRMDAATADLRAVLRADIIWLMVPRGASIGAWVEFGAALGANYAYAMDDEPEGPSGRAILTYVSGASDRSIFTALACDVYATHEEAFAAIVEMEKP